MIPRRHEGFTLVELMVVIVVLGILVAVAIPRYSAMRVRAYDATMKSDLHNVFLQIEDYQILNGTLPPDEVTFEVVTGFALSPGVTWNRFDPEVENGIPSIHIHLEHPGTANKWHAHYPAQGSAIEVR